MSQTTLEIHFDYRSPFAYILSQLLPGVAERHQLSLDWKPMDLLGLSSFAGGMPYSDKKRAYVFVDVVRCAQFHGVEIRPPSPFTVDADLALRLALASIEDGCFDALHPALFQAAWCDQKDLSSDAILRSCVEAAGGDCEELLARARASESKQQLERATAASDEIGVFGVPTMVLDGELFWGVDVLPVLEWRLSQP